MSMQHQPQESFNLCWVSEAQYKTHSYSVVHTVYISTLHKSVAEWSKWATTPGFAMRSASQIIQHTPWHSVYRVSKTRCLAHLLYFYFWLLTVHEIRDCEQGCFPLKIHFDCAFLQGNRYAVRKLLLPHMTMKSAKENEFLWPFFLKMTVNKWIRNIVITVNVIKTPHIYKVLTDTQRKEKSDW